MKINERNCSLLSTHCKTQCLDKLNIFWIHHFRTLLHFLSWFFRLNVKFARKENREFTRKYCSHKNEVSYSITDSNLIPI